ncbi:MAG TPA: PKD domain-containing protein [Nitrososphaera sp.]
MVASVLFVAPSTAMAQQTTTTAETASSSSSTGLLTPQDVRDQNRLGNVTTAITRNLQKGEMQVNGIVYTPRWSNPVWVQPNSLSVLFEYCLPGEFADSGQHILGSRDLDVLESYSVALSPVMTGWLIVVENQNQTERIPAAVGVICASDANDIDTRIISPQEQTVIKNVIQQFLTIRNIQKTNITQIINIINNITTNQTGGGNNNQTGNQTGGGNNTTFKVTATWEPISGPVGQGNVTDTFAFRATVQGGTEPYTYRWDFGDGQTATGKNVQHKYENYLDQTKYNATVTVTDATNQTASDTTEVDTIGVRGQYPLTVSASWDVNDGGIAPANILLDSTVQGGRLLQGENYQCHWDFGDGTTGDGCSPFHTYEKPGHFNATVTASDSVGNTATDSIRIPIGTPSGLNVGIIAEPMTDEIAPSTWSFRASVYDPVSNNRTESDYTYHWNFGDGQTSDSPGRTVTHTFENPGRYQISVTVTDPDGKTATSDPEECCDIGIIARLEVQITKDIQDGTEAPSSWCFEPSFVTGAEGVPPYSYSWYFGDGASSYDREVCHTFEQPGDYDVELTVYDSVGGHATATTTIRVLPPLGTTTGGAENATTTTTEEQPPTTNETAAVTQPPTTGGETTTTTPPATTEGEEGASTTTPPTTGGETTTTTPPITNDTLGQ